MKRSKIAPRNAFLIIAIISAVLMVLVATQWSHAEPNPMPNVRQSFSAQCDPGSGPCTSFEDTFDFDIPGSTLSDALDLFSEKTHLAMMWGASRKIESEKIPPVKGRMSAAEALADIVAGTNLDVEYLPDHHQIALFDRSGEPAEDDSDCDMQDRYQHLICQPN